MAPNRLARALSRLHDIVARSRVADVLAPFRLYATAPRPDIHLLLQTFADLQAAKGQLGEPELAILQALGLREVLSAAWWGAMITAATRGAVPDDLARALPDICARLDLVANGFPALARLMGSAAEADEADEANASGLVLTLSGRDGEPPALPRVASTLHAIEQLWSVAEDLTGQRGTLRLAAVDPGPVTALSFDGLAEPLQELRALLASIWDQLARLPNIPSEQHSSLVTDMLPVMDRIGRSGRSDALRVRSVVESGVRRLLEAGCELRDRAGQPGMAMASALPVPPLAPAETAAQAMSEQDMVHLADVIAEERRQLQQVEPARRLWQSTVPSRAG